MENPNDFCEAEFVTTTTTKKSASLGSWGGSTINSITSSARKIQMDKDGSWGSLRDWGSDRGQPDGSKISLTGGERSVSSDRHLSDNSRDSGDLDDDIRSVSSTSSDRRSKRALDAFTSRNVRSRRSANFFRDDFDDTMEQMIHDFDTRFSNSFWMNDDDDGFFHRQRRSRNSDEFFSRPRVLNRDNLPRSRLLPSMFDATFEDGWSDRKSCFDGDCAESGIFSDRASSRQSNPSDDVIKKEKAATKLAADKFEVDIDVQGFRPNELLVRTEGHRLTIAAVKKDKDGNPVSNFRKENFTYEFRGDLGWAGHCTGLQTLQLEREFVLPEGVNPYDVTSNLMPDGFLRVEAPIRGRQGRPQISEQSTQHSEVSNHQETGGAPANAERGPSS